MSRNSSATLVDNTHVAAIEKGIGETAERMVVCNRLFANVVLTTRYVHCDGEQLCPPQLRF